MTYDRDLPLYMENDHHTSRVNPDGSSTQLYGVGFLVTGYASIHSGYRVDLNQVDVRARPAAEWLEARGHLEHVCSSRGRHVIVYLERDEYLLFKLTFVGLM